MSVLTVLLLAVPLPAQEVRVALSPRAFQSSSPLADFSGLADEQDLSGDPPKGTPQRGGKQAQEELARRPALDLPPFGRVQLVDEVVCGAASPSHQFRESPAGVSRVETILGQPCRVLRPTEGEASYMALRLGRCKLLQPGATYVLAVNYPEDQPLSVLVINQFNETSRGFHTGTTFGDALHPKYVTNNPESLRAPLSGRYETWTLYFNLHDRLPDLASIRGAKERILTAENGFDVVIALNEHMDFDQADQPKLGYFIADIERAGPACMMAEALAVANGDPTLLGYLQGWLKLAVKPPELK